jgi:hypothetical protein
MDIEGSVEVLIYDRTAGYDGSKSMPAGGAFIEP